MGSLRVVLHVVNHTGDQLAVYTDTERARVATVVGDSACVTLRLVPGVACVLGFKRTSEQMIYAQPAVMDAVSDWEIVVERQSRTGTLWPYAIVRGCKR